MTWVEGTPLAEFMGVFSLLADDLQEADSGELALRWLRSVCLALDVLHRNGLVHGDVSPRNLIVSGGDLVLTDFDFVTKIGEIGTGPGTTLYCSPAVAHRGQVHPSDDIYALAASMFHVLFEREPFRHAGQYDKQRGLNWGRAEPRRVAATHSFHGSRDHLDTQHRFASVADVTSFLAVKVELPPPRAVGECATVTRPSVQLTVVSPTSELKEQRVSWLRDVLRSYPGSPGGNQETRGLDSKFAADTYVETLLEETLLRDIRVRGVRLVILCGNAGDGKLPLQHLCRALVWANIHRPTVFFRVR